MAITVSGIGSGIDIEGLVSQLVAAEGQPYICTIGTKRSRLSSRFVGYRNTKKCIE